MAHESEKTRMERIMSELAPDGSEKAKRWDGVPASPRRRVGEEELLAKGRRRVGRSADLPERLLADVRQKLIDEMAFKGMTKLGLARRSGMDRRKIQRYFSGKLPNITLAGLEKLADAIGVEVRIWFEDKE